MSNIPSAATPRFFVGETGETSGTRYTVALEIADQPVKASRRDVRCVSAIVMRNGEPLLDAEVSVGFHPLHAPKMQHAGWQPSELLLAHDHHPQSRPEQLHGSLTLQAGVYEVEVTVNREARTGFTLDM
ncbi:hypothetical protein [Hydrocarboniphaga effusa]|uniref:hypothetical protein n=1 Tax=Hydrocarboniphaga effusa TaxID=243629 RepID=UPI003137DAC4